MANSININQNNNGVTLQDNNGGLSITNNNTGTTINVTQPVTNVVTVATPGPQGPAGIPITSGSFTGSFSGSFIGDLTGTASNATSASYAINASNATSASYATSASNATNASNATSASYAQTASYVTLAQTASYVTTAQTASYILQAVSASYALTASYLEGYISPFPYSGSAVITGSLTVSGSSTLTNIGPAIFSGSLIVTQGITGSLFGTSSYALTASYAMNGGSGGGGNFIATGSVSASVSLGTGSFTVTSGSSTFMFVSSSGNVGFGTTTPAFKVDISGSTRITDGTQGFIFRQYTAASNFSAIYPITATPSATNHILATNGSNNISINGPSSTAKIFFGINAVDIAAITSNGLLIGTITDSGYKLDVNGTARIQTSLVLNGSSALLSSTLTAYQNGANRVFSLASSTSKTDATTRILFSLNSSESTNQQALDFQFNGASSIGNRYYSLQTSESGIAYGGGFAMQKDGGWVGIGTSTNAGYTLNVSGSTNITGNLTVTGSATLTGALTASNAIISGNVTVLGTASINTLIVNQTQLSTGSNQLGDAADDFQTLYGTVRIPTGSLTVSGALAVTSLRATVSITDTTAGGSNPTFFGAYDDFLQLAVNRNPSTGVYAQPGKASSQISLEGSTSSGTIRFYNTNTNGASPTEKFRIFGTGNTLIQNGGTFTDAGYLLDVQGTARVSDNLTVSKNQNQITQINLSNTTSGNIAGPILNLTSDVASGIFQFGKQSTTTGTYKTIGQKDGFIYNGTGGDIAILNDFATGLIKFAAGGVSTAQMTLFSTGNVTINSTTDAGFKFDVNGTARVKGTGTTSATFALTVQNSAGTNLMRLQDDGYLNVFAGVFTSALRGVNVEFTNLLYGPNFWSTSDGSTKIGSGQSAATTSAILQLDSTTKGFLPPRTNLTSNISSPAQGLMTYLTGSTNEGLYYYNSGSTPGWRQVADTTFVSASLSGSAGYVPVFTGANSVSSSVIFQSGSRVGIGTVTPAYTLDISGSTRITEALNIGNYLFSLNGNNVLSLTNPTGVAGQLYLYGGTNTQANIVIYGSSGGASNQIHFRNNTTVNGMFFSNGNFALGSSTDAGSKFLVKGTGTTSATTALLVQNSNTSASLTVTDDGFTTIPTWLGVGGVTTQSGVGEKLNVQGAALLSGTGGASNFLLYQLSGASRFILGSEASIGGTANNYINYVYGNNSFITYTNGLARLTVTGGGNVGIGTTSPSSSLHVAGTTRISGSFNTAASGSILTVQGSGSAQPIFTVQGSQGELFSITDSLSGSLFSVNDISGLPILEVFSDSSTLIGNYQDPMLITTAKVVQTNSGSFTVYSLPTASYDTAFFEYSVRSGSNARAGTIMAIQSGSAVNFTETTTTDFGSTSAVSFTVIVTGSNMALTGSSTSGAWTIKTIVRGI